MSALSIPTLVSQIQDLSLLEAGQIEELPRLAQDASEPALLLEELQRRAWLTPYQAKVLGTGHGAGLVLGSYQLVEILGTGAMGCIFRANQMPARRTVALKVIPPDTLSRRSARRFQREIQIVARLAHPNIVRGFDAGRVGRIYYLAMEFVNGIDLAQMVKQTGPLPPPLACDLIRQAARALHYAHDKGMIHRDIKPSNLMVARNPDLPPLVKLLDFGLARLLNDPDGANRLTHVGGVVGTVDYISPEQATDARQADARSDIFSLGATLFYILTGEPPYPGKDVVEKVTARVQGSPRSMADLRVNLPAGLEEVVRKMLARDPDSRYGNGMEVALALEPFCRDSAPVQLPVTPPPRTALLDEPGSFASLVESGFLIQPLRPQAQKTKGWFTWPLIAVSVCAGGVLLGFWLAYKLTDPTPLKRDKALPVRPEQAPPEPEKISEVKALARALITGSDSERLAAVETLAGLGEKAGPAAAELGQAVADKQMEVGRRAATVLARLGSEAGPGVVALGRILNKGASGESRRLATEVLATLGYPINKPALPALLARVRSDPDPTVRQRAVWSLFDIPDLDSAGAAKPLEELLGTKGATFQLARYDAAWLMAEKKGPTAPNKVLEILIQQLNNKSLLVYERPGVSASRTQDARYLAVEPLLKIVTPQRLMRIRRVLKRAAEQTDPVLRQFAQAALMKLS